MSGQIKYIKFTYSRVKLDEKSEKNYKLKS
jgi:hypothetical protein